MSNLIFLMGAPSGRLNWDEDKLLKTCMPPFESEDTKGLDEPNANRTVSSYTGIRPKWRLLSYQSSSPLRHALENRSVDEALFLQDADFVTEHHEHSNITTLSQFYDHSFSFHETTCVSVTESLHADSTDESGPWEDSSSLSMGGDSQPGKSISFQLPVVGGLSDLADIPSAVYLQSIMPQTMSVNLIVCILKVEQPRQIVTRTGQCMDLVELLVGDDTRAGFRITFWLVPLERTTNVMRACDETDTRASLADLRPRDIVLLRTVGLSSFRNGVYGQSLRNSVTKLDLLHRDAYDENDTYGMYSLRRLKGAANDREIQLKNPQLHKVLRVKEWLAQFVEIGAYGAARDRGSMRLAPPRLPPDSQ